MTEMVAPIARKVCDIRGAHVTARNAASFVLGASCGLPTVAALYVDPNGCYVGLPGVDPWDEARDARIYAGPHPVVAHPPCQRWGRFWHGSTRKPHQYKLGDDGGCFAAALDAVMEFGGVLEHPAHSKAWDAFRLRKPVAGAGWQRSDMGHPSNGYWVCYVEQGHYGHMSRKPTWLLANTYDKPQELNWAKGEQRLPEWMIERYGYEKARRIGVVAMVGGKNKTAIRNATPVPFRDLLLSIARAAAGAAICAASLSANAAPGCGPWEPARDPFRGDQAEAVMRLTEIPEIERRQLADMVRQRYGWRRVMVGRDSIDGGKLGELRSMNFGAGRICAGPVDRSTWPAGRHESGLAFTVGRWSIITFDSCRNVALASETMALLPPRPYTPAEIRAGQRGGLGALGLPSMSVPEPSTWPLVAVALAGVVAMRGRRK